VEVYLKYPIKYEVYMKILNESEIVTILYESFGRKGVELIGNLAAKSLIKRAFQAGYLAKESEKEVKSVSYKGVF
jgi:hypothetical protein